MGVEKWVAVLSPASRGICLSGMDAWGVCFYTEFSAWVCVDFFGGDDGRLGEGRRMFRLWYRRLCGF